MIRMPANVDSPHISRIHTFDLLRGYFLIVILLNHLSYYPNGLDWLTGRGNLYVSSAEGFFLISGIVLGIVRGQKLIAKPFSLAAKLLLKRSVQLYVTSFVLVILFTLIGWLMIDNPGIKVGVINPGTPLLELIWQTATFQYLYGWADFLRLYAMFLAAAPLALWMLRRGWWHIVLALSAGIWLLFPGEYSWHEGFMLMPISWQFVFFSGFVIGYHWPWLNTQWSRLRPRWRTTIGVSLLSATVITAIISALLVFGYRIDGALGQQLAGWHQGLEFSYFDKSRLPIPRLLLGAVWFWGLFWLVRRYEGWFIRRLGWLLTPFGVNSLYVYTIQAFIVFFLHAFVLRSIPPSESPGGSAWLLHLSLSSIAIMIVWLMVRHKILFRIIPR